MTNRTIPTISVQELFSIRCNNPDTCLIDVREPSEWGEVHIPGALHIPKDTLTGSIAKHMPDRSEPIYIHCRSGGRSLFAANCLLDMGYEKVFSVDGGITEWESCGYPVEK